MSWYPLMLRLQGKDCLVIGGGRVAFRKVSGLLAARANVTVIAPALCAEIECLVKQKKVAWLPRRYESADLDGAYLAITATDDPDVNAQVYHDGEALRVLVNSADDPDNCHFILPASIRRGDLIISISTGGASPAMAAILRERLEAEIGEEWGTLTELMAEAREKLQRQGRSTEGMGDIWRAMVSDEILQMIGSGDLNGARRRIVECLS